MNRDVTDPAVFVDRLTKVFGDFTAVDRVSFEVRKGEIFGFLGPNGAGKTTTLKILAGLLSPTSGGGTVAGLDIQTEAEGIKHHIGYMSQLFSLYSDLTVEENIAFFSGLNGVPPLKRSGRFEWVLEMGGLKEHRKRLTRDLPLGWKQRLALGCAVLHEPPILFLDEPTSGVDPISRGRFWDLIHTLIGQGVTVFVSTHYMEEAEYCHRLALMNRGRLIALDSPARLRSNLRQTILELQTDDSLLSLETLKGRPGIIETSMFGRNIHVMVEDLARERASIPAWLSSRGISIRKIEEVAPTLEDVFVSLIHAEGGAVLG